MTAPLTSLSPNTLFNGRYRIVRRISAGGMGAVYEVLDDKTKSSRALKVMLPTLVEDPKLRERFALEAHVTGGIETDHLVRVLDAGIDEPTGIPFLVMDLLRGQDIGSMIKTRGHISPSDTVLFLRQAAFALDKTHAAHIVHRDLKPENLFVTYRDDGSPCVKVLDFGIAKVLTPENTTKTTETLGTPLYMAPEQVRGHSGSGPWIDIYAIAHIAYAMLVGEAYFKDEKEQGYSVFEMFTCIVEGAREAPSVRAMRRRNIRLPAAFDAWFAKAAALNPASRFSSVSSEISALSEVLAGFVTQDGRPSMPLSNPVVIAPPGSMHSVHAAHTPPANMPSYSQNIASYSPTPISAAATQSPRAAPARSGMWKVFAAIAAGGVFLLLGLGLFIERLDPEEKNSVSGQLSEANTSGLKEKKAEAAAPTETVNPGSARAQAAPSGEAVKVAEMTPEQRRARRAEIEAKCTEGKATLKEVRLLRSICQAQKDKKCAVKSLEEIKRRMASNDGEIEDLMLPEDDEELMPPEKPPLRHNRPRKPDLLEF